MVLDLSTFSLSYSSAGQSGQPWELCRDDALLQHVGLPAYRSSLARYLYQPAAGKDTHFVPIAGEAKQSAATVAPARALGLSERVIPFNIGAGLMMVIRFHPLSYEDYADLLAGLATDKLCDRPALFLRGENSDYIQPDDEVMIRRLFPRAEIRVLAGAGHWLHADVPESFFRNVQEFLRA